MSKRTRCTYCAFHHSTFFRHGSNIRFVVWIQRRIYLYERYRVCWLFRKMSRQQVDTTRQILIVDMRFMSGR